jgi:hypothetical protein
VGVYLNKNGDISMIRIMLFIVFCTAGIALSGFSSSPGFAERARGVVTGANPPALTSAQIAQRAQDVQNPDVLTISRLHVTTDSERVPEFVLESDCAGTTCTFTNPETGSVQSVTLTGVSGNIEGAQTVLTRNGVTTYLQEAQGGDASLKAYGAWLEHGAFAVVEETGVVEGIELSGIYGLAAGRSSNSRPSVDATYRGLMVGSPVGGAHRGNILQGDAELVYTSADNEVDAHFTDIRDLDRGSPHATSRIDFENLAVEEDGLFADGQPGNGFIEGGFAGPGHAEALGIFESDNIVGAFGAARE